MTDIKIIDKIKALHSFDKAISTFWERYDATVSNPRCDKHGATFNGDSRFLVFRTRIPVEFNAYTGYYGNSGCSTFSPLNFNPELANHYFIKALNAMKRDIFTKMAEFARADAAKLTDEAELELEALRLLIEDTKQEVET